MEQGRDPHGGNHVAASVSQALASVQLQRPPSHDDEENQAAMEVNSTSSQSRDTSVLSMDDLEAAQALEVLRAGKSCLVKALSSIHMLILRILQNLLDSHHLKYANGKRL